ncbi:hypothetical protein BQ8482_90159 [Mesorhizobium delmotii]|uniref:Uncharacterized protein n=1 Tax=Mesorhizobium delmotii TaxID=1631247 RepID=A0A2P9AX49_9HYPH|nr:hypothetical protein BQ8482_90159 [Mesorhizobium delmotii]
MAFRAVRSVHCSSVWSRTVRHRAIAGRLVVFRAIKKAPEGACVCAWEVFARRLHRLAHALSYYENECRFHGGGQ